MNINIVVRVPDIVEEAGLRVMANTPSVIALHITVGTVVLAYIRIVMFVRAGIKNLIPA